jgi:hypothetical protein
MVGTNLMVTRWDPAPASHCPSARRKVEVGMKGTDSPKMVSAVKLKR